MVLRAHVLLSWCLFLPLAAFPAQADPIKVTFTAFPAVGDPVNTGPSTGSFSFDSSLIPPGGGQVQDSTFGLGATDINFTWSNTLWTTANADIGELQFSASGQLLAWVLGGTPLPSIGGIYGFIVAPASAVVDDIFARTFAGFGGASVIDYTNAGFEGTLQGRLVTNSVPAPVPEPSTLLLFATGTALIGRVARRRRRIQM